MKDKWRRYHRTPRDQQVGELYLSLLAKRLDMGINQEMNTENWSMTRLVARPQRKEVADMEKVD